MANLSTEGDACRNKADGVGNGRRLRALAKGLTRKARSAGGSTVSRKGLAYLFASFFCKKYDKPAAEASRKARKNYGQRVGYGLLKY